MRWRSAGFTLLPPSDYGCDLFTEASPDPETGERWSLKLWVVRDAGVVGIRRAAFERTVPGLGPDGGTHVRSWTGPLNASEIERFPSIFLRQLQVLLDGEVPPLGTPVVVDGRPSVIDWLGPRDREPVRPPSPDRLGIWASGRVLAGGSFEAPLEAVEVTGEEPVADEELTRLVRGQPVSTASGARGVVRGLARTRSGAARVQLKVPGKKVFWTDASDVRAVAGWTAWHTAALVDDVAATRSLAGRSTLPLEEACTAERALAGGRRVSYVDVPLGAGMTPLHVAARFGSTSVFAALWREGGEELRDAAGRTGLSYLCEWHAEAAAAWARSAGVERLVFQRAVDETWSGPVLLPLLLGGIGLDTELPDGRTVRSALAQPRLERVLKMFEEQLAERTKREEADRRRSSDLLEPSRSSKTKCRHCRKKIRRGAPMFGLASASGREFYHLDCARTAHPDRVALLEP